MTEPKCVRCGGTDDLMDRGMAPGMTYCVHCRRALRDSSQQLPDNDGGVS